MNYLITEDDIYLLQNIFLHLTINLRKFSIVLFYRIVFLKLLFQCYSD